MAGSLRQSPDRLTTNAEHASLAHTGQMEDLWTALEHAPYSFDLFFTLRMIEGRQRDLPRLGKAMHPYEERVRIGQQPTLVFAPATLAHAERIGNADGVGKIWQYAFGLFGPNGPLPTHLSELAHERTTHAKDKTLVSFADIFHHRATVLFFRAWANAQSTNSLDREDDDSFTRYVGSLIGYGVPALEGRDRVTPHALRHVSGHFVRQTRNAEGLEQSLRIVLQTPAAVEMWRFGWLELDAPEQTQLGRLGADKGLGVGAVAGRRVPDRQHRFRLRLGAMPLGKYQQMLPIGQQFQHIIDWVRNYIGYEFEWDLQLVLRRDEVPSAQLGRHTQLGWTSWLTQTKRENDADDLVLSPEKIVRGPGSGQQASAFAA
ncbi:MAG: type VI secretion system baseplate subunit TssG [Casimicrobium sp.]